jgi:hypothetical protein
MSEKHTFYLVSIGERITKAGALKGFFRVVAKSDSLHPVGGRYNLDESQPDSFAFSKLRYRCGVLLRIEGEKGEDGGIASVNPSTAHIIGTWSNSETLLEWVAMQDMARGIKQQERAEKNIDAYRHLEPLRRLYRYSTPQQRAIIAVRVLSYLQG